MGHVQLYKVTQVMFLQLDEQLPVIKANEKNVNAGLKDINKSKSSVIWSVFLTALRQAGSQQKHKKIKITPN